MSVAGVYKLTMNTPMGLQTPTLTIVEEDGATTVVPPGFTARQDRYGIMTLTRERMADGE